MSKEFDSEEFRDYLRKQNGSYESVFFTGESEGQGKRTEFIADDICKGHNILEKKDKKWKTLVMQLEEADYDLSGMSQEDIDKASAIFAEEARGNVHIIMGESGRSNSRWNTIERDKVIFNRHVNKDIEFIDPVTKKPTYYDKTKEILPKSKPKEELPERNPEREELKRIEALQKRIELLKEGYDEQTMTHIKKDMEKHIKALEGNLKEYTEEFKKEYGRELAIPKEKFPDNTDPPKEEIIRNLRNTEKEYISLKKALIQTKDLSKLQSLEDSIQQTKKAYQKQIGEVSKRPDKNEIMGELERARKNENINSLDVAALKRIEDRELNISRTKELSRTR